MKKKNSNISIMNIILNGHFLFLLLGFSAFSLNKTQKITTTPVNARAADSLELVNFYHETRGDLWKKQWDFNQPMDTWFGVTLNNLGRVSCLDLDGEPDCRATKKGGNHLHGSLPEINLPFLEHLFLSSNQISGTLPEFSNTPHLLTLQISGNRLEGALPDFYNLKKLVKLDLEYNYLEGNIPNFDLPKLQTLYLGQNMLNGKLPRMEHCPKLKHLYTNNNELNGSLPDFAHLTELQQLIVFENFFDGELPEYHQLKKLNILDVSNNFLRDCFQAKNYEQFKRFNADGNNLSVCTTVDMFVPSAFSPNGDGINDFFEIEDFPQLLDNNNEAEFVVYGLNRSIVFSNNKFEGKWDGKNNNGHLLPDGLYVFFLKAGPYLLKQTLYIKK